MVGPLTKKEVEALIDPKDSELQKALHLIQAGIHERAAREWAILDPKQADQHLRTATAHRRQAARIEKHNQI